MACYDFTVPRGYCLYEDMIAYLSQRVGQVSKPIPPPDNGTEE